MDNQEVNITDRASPNQATKLKEMAHYVNVVMCVS